MRFSLESIASCALARVVKANIVLAARRVLRHKDVTSREHEAPGGTRAGAQDMATMKFNTKAEAAEIAAQFLLSGPVWISGAVATIEKLTPGWYVAFPENISRRYLQDTDIERVLLSATRYNTGWI